MMPKKILLLLIAFLCLCRLNAQEKNNLKLSIEAGFLPLSSDSENLGLFLNVEPKLKVLDHVFIGLRLGLVINSSTFENYDETQFIIHEEFDHGVFSFTPTVDYYFNENRIRPYLGAGIGVHLLSDIDVSRTFVMNPAEDVFEVRVDKKLGFLLRGGVEVGKMRLGIDYSFVTKADIEIRDEPIIGTVDNSYFGVSIGLIIGGGKVVD